MSREKIIIKGVVAELIMIMKNHFDTDAVDYYEIINMMAAKWGNMTLENVTWITRVAMIQDAQKKCDILISDRKQQELMMARQSEWGGPPYAEAYVMQIIDDICCMPMRYVNDKGEWRDIYTLELPENLTFKYRYERPVYDFVIRISGDRSFVSGGSSVPEIEKTAGIRLSSDDVDILLDLVRTAAYENRENPNVDYTKLKDLADVLQLLSAGKSRTEIENALEYEH